MSAAKTFEEAHERHEHAHEGPRWIPVAAAALAVMAALSGYFANVRSTSALFAKNESIVATTHASDTYAQYQAERLKFYVSQSAIDQGVNANGDASKLAAQARRENAKAHLKDHEEIGEAIEHAIRANAGLVAEAMMAAPGEAAVEE